tara:strand:+ start:66 stop:260 length:195 start_codon:yes stop_codon:yes gene_type:complete
MNSIQLNEPYTVSINKNKEKNKETKNTSLKVNIMCEWCGRHPATINLELKYGSYRECRYCWDRS